MSKRTCSAGHVFEKTSSCPTCPICEQQKRPQNGFLSGLSAPARRAFEAQGILSEEQVMLLSKKEILSWHGVGKSTITYLERYFGVEWK